MNAAMRPGALSRNVMRVAITVPLAASLAGLLIALWAHVESLRGVDPRSLFPGIWLLQLVVNALLAPLVVSFFRKGIPEQMNEFPRWIRIALVAFGAYYSLHFYLFMKIAADEIRAEWTWRMFSAGWMALFALPAAYYWTLLRDAD